VKVSSATAFQSHALEFIERGEPVFVTRRGRLAALLLPLEKPEGIPTELRRELLAEVGKGISRHLTRKGITEARIQRDFEAWRKTRRTAGRRR